MKSHSYLVRQNPFAILVGNSEYSDSYKSAIGFGVCNPIFQFAKEERLHFKFIEIIKMESSM